MRTIILTVLFVGFFIALPAQETAKSIPSKITDATVFLSGAELTHTATATLAKGDNELKIEKLSPSIDRNSLRIKANNGVIVSAFEFSVDDLPVRKPNEGRIKELNDSLELIGERLNKINAEINIDGELTKMMRKGIDKNVADTAKTKELNELIKLMDYYQNKSMEIENRQIANQNKKKKLDALIKELNQRLSVESTKEYEKTGVLTIRCTSPMASSVSFTVSYYTPLANWIPYYDIHVQSTDKPIKIVSKAKVSQLTTVNWNNVRLTLSTATPGSGKVAPLFNTWFLKYVNNAALRDLTLSQNAYSYRSQKAYSYAKNEMEFSEVVEKEKSIDDYIITEETMLSQTFNIDLPYSIPGDGKEQSIELKTQEINADFRYYCAPKLSSETYLLAEIADWEKLNLLNGKANITYDGTYMGETFINASSTQEKLGLTLGADKRVVVKRELLKDFSSSKFLGNDVKQVFTYKLTVKNNQNKPVRVVLKEQYPQSSTKEIESIWLKDDTTKPTFHNEEVGVVTWEEDFKPGETKEYKFSYSIKYPKGKEVR
ncbi:MAG: DUF4139 domain-containing protein [Dysgonamonadaceae bacterium]|jgi:uncharacterized protein (TIGR02231 family)|nr:DUF4139 domain-containing protein [Dysgonamonadaceae bacterium]